MKDRNTILISKFGGRIPVLKTSNEKESPKYPKCNEYLEMQISQNQNDELTQIIDKFDSNEELSPEDKILSEEFKFVDEA